MSRHRKIQYSRSKAVALIAAGAFTVATAATAAAATWPSGSSGPAAGHAHEAAAGSLLTTTGQAFQMQAFEQSTASQALQAYQIRDAAASLSAARWKTAREQAAKKAAAARAAQQAAAAQPAAQATSQPTASAQPAPSATASAAPAASGSPQQIAQAMLASFGWSSGQFSCLDPLWAHESGWSVTAYNAGLGRLRHSAGAARLPDGQRGTGLADQRGDADQVGPGVHQGHLRIPVRRLGSRAGHRLVLVLLRGSGRWAAPAGGPSTCYVSGANVSASSSKIGRIWFHMPCGAVMYSA